MTRTCNIFIGWSGERSRLVAEFLRGWIPKVIQSARPWMSDADIEKGARGLNDIARALSEIKVGISCLTPENLLQPWMSFEAGAVSKTIDDQTRLCTFLIGGLQPQDVRPPLGIFQGTRAVRDDTLKLMRTINRAVSDDPIPDDHLEEVFSAMWPKLEERLSTLPLADENVRVTRSPDDMVAEILEIVRGWASRNNQDMLPSLTRGASFVSPGSGLIPGEPFTPIVPPLGSVGEGLGVPEEDVDLRLETE
jgi:hypothetical protein